MEVVPINVIRIKSDNLEKDVAGCILVIKSKIKAEMIVGINTRSAKKEVKEANNKTPGFHRVTSIAPPERAIPAVKIGYIPKNNDTN